MLSFALAVGHHIPEPVLAALREPCPADLPFRATQHLLWDNPTATVLFAGWQDDVDLGMGSRWHRAPDALTAFTGHVWPRSRGWRTDEPWSAQLASHLRGASLTSALDELLGVYTLVSLDSDGRGVVTSDRLGTGPLYRARSRSLTIISSRAGLAARLVSGGSFPARDVLGAGWLSFCGFPMGARTGYEGVEALASGERAEVSPDGVCYVQGPPPWGSPVHTDHDLALGELSADIATSIRGALAYPVEHRVVELTGGKDSRLILAALVAEGMADQFEYRTFGSADLPDAVVAKRLTGMFGLRHEIGRRALRQRRTTLQSQHPQRPQREFRLLANVGALSCSRNAWELAPAAPPTGELVTLSGLCGEALATNHPNTTVLRNHTELRRALLVDSKFGAARILKADALEHYRSELLAVVYDGLSDADAPQDVIDAWYIRQRLRRWFGTTQEADERNRVFPLHSPIGVALAFSLGPRDRRSYWIHRQILDRTCPQLGDMPFATGRWPTAVVPTQTPEPATPTDPTELPVASDSRSAVRRFIGAHVRRRQPVAAANEERRRSEGTDVHMMRRYLLDEPPEPLFEILDRPAVERAIARFDRLGEESKKQVYGAMTAAIWLGGHELTPSTA